MAGRHITNNHRKTTRRPPIPSETYVHAAFALVLGAMFVLFVWLAMAPAHGWREAVYLAGMVASALWLSYHAKRVRLPARDTHNGT